MQFWSIKGLVPYSKASEIQQKLVEKRIADEIPDTVLFLEHTPVVTQGRGLQWIGQKRAKHEPVPRELPSGVVFEVTQRGGDLTYHGPGQLVVYPIVKLDGLSFGPKHDVEKYIRKLEEVFSKQLKKFGLVATARKNATGVWVDDKKVVSIGIAVRRWVAYHGIAINVMNDMSPFNSFSPCGFSSDVMTNLSSLKLNKKLDKANWRSDLELSLTEIFLKESQFQLSDHQKVNDLILVKSSEEL